MIRFTFGIPIDMTGDGHEFDAALGDVLGVTSVSRTSIVADTTTGAEFVIRGRFNLTSEATLLNSRIDSFAAEAANGDFIFSMTGLRPLTFDDIIGGDGELTLLRSARGGVRVFGSEFDDVLIGGPAADVIRAGDGNDDVRGAGGADILFGDDGDDTLNGGGARDRMMGGDGDDTYRVNHTRDLVREAADGGNDLVLSNRTFVLGAHVEELTLTGGRNINGFGNAEDNLLDGNNRNNRLVGRGGDDIIDGGGGRDHLLGGGGDDVLDGGVGGDRMQGAGGDDVYFVDHVLDRVIEPNGAGNDTVWSTIDYTLPNHVENLQLRHDADLNGTGNALDNVLVGNEGDNILRGLLGDDWLFPGSGMDTLTGDEGVDGFVFDTITQGASADLITDFAPGTDLILLDSGVFDVLQSGQQTAANFRAVGDPADGNDFLVFDIASGILSYDESGGGGALQAIADVGTGTNLTAADIFVDDHILAGLLPNGGVVNTGGGSQATSSSSAGMITGFFGAASLDFAGSHSDQNITITYEPPTEIV